MDVGLGVHHTTRWQGKNVNDGRDIGGTDGTTGETGDADTTNSTMTSTAGSTMTSATTGSTTGTTTAGTEDDGESWPDRWLLPGETVLWRGRRAVVRRTLNDYATASGILIAIGAVWMFSHSSGNFVTGLIILSGAATTSFLVAFRILFLAPRTLRRQRYALTDRRLLIGSTRPGEPTLSWYRDQLAEPYVKQNRDGTSSIGLGGMPAPDAVRNLAPRPPVLSSIAHPDLFLVLLAASPATTAPAMLQAVSPPGETGETGSDAAVDGWSPRPGERVLWTGRPARLPWRFATEERFGLVSDLLLAALFVALTAQLIYDGHRWLFPEGAAVSVYYLHLAVGRLALRRMRFARSTYAVTDQRVVAVWKLRRTVVTEADHRTLRPPLVLADGSVFFAESRRPSLTLRWPPEDPTTRKPFDRRRRTRPAAVGEPPNFVGLADPWTAARIAADARDAAWTARPVDHGR